MNSWLKRFGKSLDNFSAGLYVEIHAANGYEEQVPQHIVAKWYDLFWFLIPIAGILLFVAAIDDRFDKGHVS